MIEFEPDDNKSHSNKLKHGVDFVEAQVLWQDNECIEVPAHTADEPRLVIVGKIGAKLWAAVVTYRNGRVRIWG